MVTERKVRKFTADEYQWMGRVGILCPDERVELLDGEIVLMSPIGSRHNAQVNITSEWFADRRDDRFQVQTQGPIRLADHSEPEPDVVLLRRRPDSYRSRLAMEDDVMLIVEVADSSLATDRQTKIPLYAIAGIPEVWLEDLTKSRVTVYRDPVEGEYQSVHTVGPGDTVAPLALPDLVVRYEDIFG